MDMNTFIKDIATYNHHVNEKLINAFNTHEKKISEKSQLLFSHLLNAHHIWNSRILNESPLAMPWDTLSSKQFKEINDSNHKKSLEILEKVDLGKKVTYQNTKGEVFSNNVIDIIYHIFNHSNYHRAQIATDMKHSGLEPVVTDYIFYKREM
jgi:uncharacterized damage-inducible protein DinB